MGENITLTEQFAVQGGKVFIAGFCNSSATKPTENIATGSYLFEVDTKQVKFFDAGTETWG